MEIDRITVEPGIVVDPIRSEAKAGTGDGVIRDRGSAQTVLLEDRQTRTFDVDIDRAGPYDLVVRYSNGNLPGDSEFIQLLIDNQLLTQFEAEDTGSGGSGWENFAVFGLPDTLSLSPGRHTLELAVWGGDGWGIEIDQLVLTRV